MKYSNNVTKAVKKLQWFSYNDEDFKRTIGSNMSFEEIIDCGFWTISQLEELGSNELKDKQRLMFNFQMRKGEGKRKLINKTKTEPNIIKVKRSRKFSLLEQLTDRKGVLIKGKDKIIQR